MEKLKNTFVAQFVCLFVCFALGTFGSVVCAQPQNDAQFMLNLGINKQLTKSLGIGFTQQYLLGENYTELTSAAYQLEVEYQLVKGIKISAAYRLTNSRNIANFYQQRQRFYADISLSRKIGRFNLSLREAFQQQYRGWALDDNPFRINTYLRSRLQLRYSANWYLTPYLSFEAHTQLFRPDRFPLARITARAGVSYRFDVHNSLDAAFFYQKNINRIDARTNYMSALSYNFSF